MQTDAFSASLKAEAKPACGGVTAISRIVRVIFVGDDYGFRVVFEPLKVLRSRGE